MKTLLRKTSVLLVFFVLCLHWRQCLEELHTEPPP